jgi:hypothetical protein
LGSRKVLAAKPPPASTTSRMMISFLFMVADPRGCQFSSG